MSTRVTFLSLIAGAVVLSACTVPEDRTRTATGAAIGAVVGGAIGATENREKALLGAALGAGAGAIIGDRLDKQAADLRQSIGNEDVEIVNTGSNLVVTMPQDILFAVDSAALQPALRSDLQAVAGNLMAYPDTTVQVIGHTDNTGSAAYNLDLSQRRAGSVASVLTGAGVPAGRVVAIGAGEDRPVASNLNEAGRAQNRRVEIVMTPNV